MNQTQLPEAGPEEDALQTDSGGSPERPTIGALLKSLRGKRSLRQVDAETGVPYTYLSSIELGQKNPGIKTLSRLAECYEVPLLELLKAAGLPEMRVLWDNPSPSSADLEFALRALKDGDITDTTVRRCYDFVMTDPDLSGLRKPEETPSADFQRFVVQMYQHYTGKKLL